MIIAFCNYNLLSFIYHYNSIREVKEGLGSIPVFESIDSRAATHSEHLSFDEVYTPNAVIQLRNV